MVAQAALGIGLLEGLDGVREPTEAFYWLSAASREGAPRAMCYLGTMYEEGLVVAADPFRARSLYERAAERGEFYARVYLARLLKSGKCGVTKHEDVLHWYRAALAQAAQVESCPELDEARAYVRSHDAGAAKF